MAAYYVDSCWGLRTDTTTYTTGRGTLSGRSCVLLGTAVDMLGGSQRGGGAPLVCRGKGEQPEIYKVHKPYRGPRMSLQENMHIDVPPFRSGPIREILGENLADSYP